MPVVVGTAPNAAPSWISRSRIRKRNGSLQSPTPMRRLRANPGLHIRRPQAKWPTWSWCGAEQLSCGTRRAGCGTQRGRVVGVMPRDATAATLNAMTSHRYSQRPDRAHRSALMASIVILPLALTACGDAQLQRQARAPSGDPTATPSAAPTVSASAPSAEPSVFGKLTVQIVKASKDAMPPRAPITYVLVVKMVGSTIVTATRWTRTGSSPWLCRWAPTRCPPSRSRLMTSPRSPSGYRSPPPRPCGSRPPPPGVSTPVRCTCCTDAYPWAISSNSRRSSGSSTRSPGAATCSSTCPAADSLSPAASSTSHPQQTGQPQPETVRYASSPPYLHRPPAGDKPLLAATRLGRPGYHRDGRARPEARPGWRPAAASGHEFAGGSDRHAYLADASIVTGPQGAARRVTAESEHHPAAAQNVAPTGNPSHGRPLRRGRPSVPLHRGGLPTARSPTPNASPGRPAPATPVGPTESVRSQAVRRYTVGNGRR